MPDYTQLRNHLKIRLETISDTQLRDSDPEKQLQMLQQASEAISDWYEINKSQIPARLNHFLKQSSLSKALDFIDDLESE